MRSEVFYASFLGVQPTYLICDSGVDVIPPGVPNQPAGAPTLDDFDWND